MKVVLPDLERQQLRQLQKQRRDDDIRAIGTWLRRYWGGDYSVSGLTQLLHQLGFSYKLTTPVPCEADPVRQTAFLVEQLQPLLAAAGHTVERLWQFLRQKIINPCFYRTKAAFRQTVLGFFDRLDKFGHEFASLLTLNFHLFPSQPTL